MKEISRREFGDLDLIAGPCSLNSENLNQVYQMSEIQIPDGKGGYSRALSGVRFVGLKSRTDYNPGPGMGIDSAVLEQVIMTGCRDEIPPSVLLAEEFVKETNMGIAAEIMVPRVQLPYYEGRIPHGQFLPWSPAVNQLGWNAMEMASVASRNDWTVGLKNGKWLGSNYDQILNPDDNTITTMEQAWGGLATYAQSMNCNVAFIHRGVDIPEKGDYRNALVHPVVARLARRFPNADRYFDPSHSLGPNLRDHIVEETIEAMKMRVGNEYLYTGMLIEAGDSKTDTKQHISIDELGLLVNEISRFRKLKGPLLKTE